jgi:hypothetical protein
MRPIILMIILMITLNGCATVPVATVKPFCRAVKPVTISKDDTITEETARGMEADNRALKKLCPQG